MFLETIKKAYPFFLLLGMGVYCLILIGNNREIKKQNKSLQKAYSERINELKTKEVKKLQKYQEVVDSLRLVNVLLETENSHLTAISTEIIKSYDKKVTNLNTLPDDSLAGLFTKYLNR